MWVVSGSCHLCLASPVTMNWRIVKPLLIQCFVCIACHSPVTLALINKRDPPQLYLPHCLDGSEGAGEFSAVSWFLVTIAHSTLQSSTWLQYWNGWFSHAVCCWESREKPPSNSVIMYWLLCAMYSWGTRNHEALYTTAADLPFCVCVCGWIFSLYQRRMGIKASWCWHLERHFL